jgi:hypothetical protein
VQSAGIEHSPAAHFALASPAVHDAIEKHSVATSSFCPGAHTHIVAPSHFVSAGLQTGAAHALAGRPFTHRASLTQTMTASNP